MRKIFTLFAAVCFTTLANAQVVKLGFESSDTKFTTEDALTPGGTFGDWVNVKGGDTWIENADDVHSGEFAFHAINEDDGSTYYSWDRGFKLGDLPLKAHTPYRVSFWIKADPGSKFASHLGVGVENFDKEIVTTKNSNFNLGDNDHPNVVNFTGDWQHVSYVAYVTDMDAENANIASWQGGDIYPERLGGDGIETYSTHFGGKFPERYFLVFNMFGGNSEYALDDITIEEASFNTIAFNYNFVKIDFGYPTNIAALAKASADGFAHFDPSCVTVTVNDEVLPVRLLEGHQDGFLYAFLDDDDMELSGEDKVVVTLTTPADIVYNTDKRPADFADGDAAMTAVSFTNEIGYFDENLDVWSSEFTAPKLIAAVPENESFELSADEFKEVRLTFDKEIDLTIASAVLKTQMGSQDLSNKMFVADDKCTLVIPVPTLADGEYVIEVANVANIAGIADELNTIQLTYQIGEDTAGGTSEDIFCPDFSTVKNGTFPPGWISNDNGTIHQYIVMDNGDIGDYNWSGNIGGGGSRMFTGFSGGDFTTALYWRSLDHNGSCTLTYGEQVNDFEISPGVYDPEMPDNIKLYLEPGKYQISFLMAAWKYVGEIEGNYPKFNFMLQDVKGNEIFAQASDVTAQPCVNGGYTLNGASTRSVADFTVSKAGYYMLKFESFGYVELLLANVKLISMPSKAAYWKQQLAAAVEPAKLALENAADAAYDCETKTKLAAEIEKAETTKFHQPSDVQAEIALLNSLAAALNARVSNINNYDAAVANLGTGLETIAEQYKTTEEYINGCALYAQYKDVKAQSLSDEELATVVPQLTAAADQLTKAAGYADILAWRGKEAVKTAIAVGIAENEKTAILNNAVTDETATINSLNGDIKGKLYELIAANGNKLPENLCTELTYIGAEASDPEEAAYDEATDSYPVAVRGIEITSFINNPHLYRVNNVDGIPAWTIIPGAEDHALAIGYNVSPDANNRVVDPQIQIYGESDYDVSQLLENLPAGIYSFVLGTRTPCVDKTSEFEKIFYYNAQNDETGIWDKFIYINNGTDEAVAPFNGKVGLGYPEVTFAKNIKAIDGKLTVGVHEHYTSGKAEKHEDNTPQSFWTGTTYVDNARLFLVDVDPDFDYATAATGIEAVNTAKVIKNGAIYNLAGQKVDATFKGVVIMNGKKSLRK